MRRLRLDDKIIFDRYFHGFASKLSMYSFASVFVWRRHFDISWQIIDDSLCVFFSNELGCFMPIEPVGVLKEKLIDKVFSLMSKINTNGYASRIENITEERRPFYANLDLKLRPKEDEYLYRISELISLSGGNFKSKRSSYNFFIKNYPYKLKRLDRSMASACLRLYSAWARQRGFKYQDKIYRACLEDTFVTQKEAFRNFSSLGLRGLAVKIGAEIKGYSLGVELNRDTFYIMFETVDLNIKGLSQFIFKSFCEELPDYKFVNCAGDCGFNNLARVKQSYRPLETIKAFIAERR